MRATFLASTVAIAMTAMVSLAHAQSAPAAKPAAPAAAPAAAAKPAAPAAAGGYTTAGTSIDILLKNPDAKAVLVKHVPDIANNPQIEQAVGMTLKDIQQYAPNVTDDLLKKIDADLAKVPVKK